MHFDADRILAVASLFERERGLSVARADSGGEAFEDMSVHSPDALQQELIRSIEDGSIASEDLSGAYWALGKRRQASLIGWFRTALRREVDRDPFAAYQIMIALNDLEEPIFALTQRSHFSALDSEENLRDAHHYLRLNEAEPAARGEPPQ